VPTTSPRKRATAPRATRSRRSGAAGCHARQRTLRPVGGPATPWIAIRSIVRCASPTSSRRVRR
jgi:hypothetical protein